MNLNFDNKFVDVSNFEKLENIDIIMNYIDNTKIDFENNKLENI